MRLQRKMACVVEMHLGSRVITFERLRARRQKERVVLAPDREQRRAFRAEVLLELRIERNVAGVIQEQVELDFVIAGSGQQCGI